VPVSTAASSTGASSSISGHPHLQKLLRALRALLWAPVAARVLCGGLVALPDLLWLDAAGKAVPLPPTARVMLHISALIRQAADWRADAVRLLAMRGPVPVAPFEGLLRACRSIPVDLRVDEARLEAVVADGGRAWCVCRGLTEGLMISCDFCDDWFHGECVGLTEAEIRALMPPPSPAATDAREAAGAGAAGVQVVSASECGSGCVDEAGGPAAKRARAARASDALESTGGAGSSGAIATDASTAAVASLPAAAAAAAPGQCEEAAVAQQPSHQFRCPACSRKAGQPYAYARRMALNVAAQGRTHAVVAVLGAISFMQRIASEAEAAQQQQQLGGAASAPSLFGAALSSGVSPPPALAPLVAGNVRLSGLSGLVDGSLS